MGGQVTAIRDLIERGEDGPIHELLRGGELVELPDRHHCSTRST